MIGTEALFLICLLHLANPKYTKVLAKADLWLVAEENFLMTQRLPFG